MGLEFNAVGAGLFRRMHHLPGQVHIPIVIDADFGNDEGRMALADFTAADSHALHFCIV